MQLIGMLDSPYVRRVAISLQLLGLPFEHRPISVFRDLEVFRSINPVVKVPTLVCDDGVTLMDSTLILEYAEVLARPRSLMPTDRVLLQQELRLIGLALAAMEKSVQIVYERRLRPAEKRHAPWLDRITAQLAAACRGLEDALSHTDLPLTTDTIRQAGVSTGAAWQFIQSMIPDVVSATDHPRLALLSATVESLPAFRAAPHGEGVLGAD